MANKNQNEVIKARIFTTKNNEIIIVEDNANAGFQYVCVQAEVLPDGTVSRVVYRNASKLHIAADVADLLSALYPKTTVDPANSCPSLTSFRAILDKDMTICLYSGKLPVSVLAYTDKDIYGVTLKDYVLNTFGYPDPQANNTLTVGFELTDVDVIDTSVSGIFKPYDVNGHDPFNNLDGADAKRLSVHTNPLLKASVLKSKLYHQITEYLSLNDEALNQKGILIYGVPGTGKTTAVRVMAEEYGMPYAAITADNSSIVEDLIACVTPNDDPNIPQQWITAWTDILKVAQAGGVVVFDEANNFSPAVQIGLNNMVYGENRFAKFQGRTYAIHPKTIFVVTTNFGEQGNNPMNAAFKQRFYPILATEFNADQYAEYLASLYPAIEPKALLEYTRLMYKCIDETRAKFDNMDRYSPDTPALYTRAISQILTMTFTKRSLKGALGDFLFAITHGVEDNKTKVSAFLADHEKEIASVEQLFFMNKQLIKESKATLKQLLSVGVSSVATADSSTNMNDVFSRASKTDNSSADSIISGLENIQW